MKKYFDVLRNCALFNEIEDEHLLAMLGCLNGTVRRFAKNEIIFAEGGPAENIGIILVGEAQIVRVDYDGNRSIVASLGVSTLVGEAFACAGIRAMPVDVVAVADSEVLIVNCERILHSCSNACRFHSQMIYNLMKIVAVKNLIFHRKIEIISKRTTREKLMAYLMMQAKECGSKSFSIPYDRQALADYLEVDRSGLSAEIGKMKKEGLLLCEKKNFTIL